MATSIGSQIGRAIADYLPTQTYRGLAITDEMCQFRFSDTEELLDEQKLQVIVQEMATESETLMTRGSYYGKTYQMRIRLQEPIREDDAQQKDLLQVLAEDIEQHLFRGRQAMAGVRCLEVFIPGEAEGFELDAQMTRRFHRLNVMASYRHILKA